MAETKSFLAVGVEAARGTKESTTVGFVPLASFSLPAPDKMAKKREEFRGEDTARGFTTEIRMGEKWDGLTLEMPAFTEAGTTKGIIGSIIKHFFGYSSSSQNATTGQYRHMMYPVNDPFAAANLDNDALTFNMNAMHAATLKNHPYVGGRVKSLSFKQEVGQHLVISVGCMGQTLATPEAGIASPVFPAENLRLDYNNLTIRAGATVTRTGTAPNYTAITSNGSQVKPDSLTLDLERGMTDKQLLNGTTTTGKSAVGMLTGKLSMTIDFEDPASGFSSVDEFTAWLAATSSTNFLLTWDSGTQAGTGDNHSLIIDLPICNRLGGMPEIARDTDSNITLEYDLLYDGTTTLYACGLLLKNTASAV